MGLNQSSSKKSSFKDVFNISTEENEFIIALAGNPNTGKSSIFNSLTGLHQHTGNWAGKTVVNAQGKFSYMKNNYSLIDLPGAYSIFSSSVEEIVARDFLCFGKYDCTVVVADASLLERNLFILFQIMEITENVILCINLIDEAEKKDITINKESIENYLGIPVVLTSAKNNLGLNELKEAIFNVSNKNIPIKKNIFNYRNSIETEALKIKDLILKENININSRWLSLRLLDGDDSVFSSMAEHIDNDTFYKIENIKSSLPKIDKLKIREEITEDIYKFCEHIDKNYVTRGDIKKNKNIVFQKKVDDILTSKTFGIPIMLLLLALVLWFTILGANVPSELLSQFFGKIEEYITLFFTYINSPDWLYGILVLGVYRSVSWVVAVMLPPMAIFFPIFTLLEDLGYLPRVAFNLDHLFKRACAHGKQCLTMCMGFGCNAAGVIGCRIIESPRERLIAILTNNFVPCNGRFPTLIAIATIFFSTSVISFGSIFPAIFVTGFILLGVFTTLIVSYFLSKTLLKGIPSRFTLELPPYRIPKVKQVIYTSIIDRTIFVLKRAVIVAIPAGLITWIFANIYIGNLSIVEHLASFLEPFANLIGLDGFILLAFILGLPANEIVLPILIMCYMSTGHMVEFESLDSLSRILLDNGWTPLTALNTMIFCLFHWPCSTTLWTIKKETNSLKWTLVSFLLPTIIGICFCFITTRIYNIFF